MRFHLGIDSKAKRLFVLSPVKQQPLNEGSPDAGLDFKSKGFGFKSPEFGSKDETFFDSHPLFDSDFEDDFYSVNGEFTPSLANTPNHQTSTAPRLDKALLFDKFSDSNSEISPSGRIRSLADLLRETSQEEAPRLDKALLFDKFSNSNSEFSPSGRRRSLADLLRETSQEEEADNVVNMEIDRKPDVYSIKTAPPRSVYETPYLSGGSSACSTETTPDRDSKYKEKARKAISCCLPSLVKSFSFNEGQKMSPARQISKRSL